MEVIEFLKTPEKFTRLVKDHVDEINQHLTRLYQEEPLNPEIVADELGQYADQIAPYIGDISSILNEALQQGRRVLAEGAQGTLLDLDHGTYPFVTSSTPTAAGAAWNCVAMKNG